MGARPGGELATRPLYFYWICDCSGSMAAEGKIQALNAAIRESLPAMKKSAEDNPNAQVFVRALKFGSDVQWVSNNAEPIDQFKWFDLVANGETRMGKALSMVADQLKIPPMTDRALPPVLVLVSDGQPTDDFGNGLKKLMEQQWGKKAVRIAIAIGRDADLDVLQKFIGHNEMKPFEAKNAEMLAQQMKWVSTTVVQSVSAPASQRPGQLKPGINVPIPKPPDNTISAKPGSTVW